MEVESFDGPERGVAVQKDTTQVLIDIIRGCTLRKIHGDWNSGDALLTDRDWLDLLRTAGDEGLAPLLYSLLKEMNVLADLPDDVREMLRNAYARTSAVNQHILAVLEEAEDVLERRGIPVIILKGAALLTTVYHDIGLRPMDDIDIMVRPRHLGDICDTLTGMGFTRHRLYPHSFQRGIIKIDLHTDLLSSDRIRSRQDTVTLRQEDIWDNAVPLNGSPSSLYRLSPYDTLIALSFHLLKHRFNRLIWFVDIAAFMNASAVEIDWMELIAYSRMLGADRLLLYVVILTKHLLGADISDHVLNDLGRGELSLIEKYILRLHITRTPLETLTDLLWIFQIRGLKKQIRFVIENSYPRREIMDQIMSPSSHPIATFGRRSVVLFRMVLSDLFSSIMHVRQTGLPPL